MGCMNVSLGWWLARISVSWHAVVKLACTTGSDQLICAKINPPTKPGICTHTRSHLWKIDLWKWFFSKSLVNGKYVREIAVLSLKDCCLLRELPEKHSPIYPLAIPKVCDCVHNPYTSIIFHGNICYLNIMQAVPSLMTVCSCSQNFKVSTRSSCTLLKKPVINFTNVFHHVMFFWSYWWLFCSSKMLAEHTWYICYSWIHYLHR